MRPHLRADRDRTARAALRRARPGLDLPRSYRQAIKVTGAQTILFLAVAYALAESLIAVRRAPFQFDRPAAHSWLGIRHQSDPSLDYSRTRVPRPMRPLTLSLSPSGGEGIETTPSPSPREGSG